jgi:quinol monooxygenase YgiN
MRESIRSMAILKPHPGKELELIAFLREFYNMMYSKHYSRDRLYRDLKDPGRFVHIRIWLSDEARADAVQDPDVHHYWMKLPELGDITTIYEELELLYSSPEIVTEDVDVIESGM